jgi:TRAP-type C4-dicarboxylate transport system permease small subunit
MKILSRMLSPSLILSLAFIYYVVMMIFSSFLCIKGLRYVLSTITIRSMVAIIIKLDGRV